MFFSSYRAGRSGEIFAWKLDLEGTNGSFCDFGCAHTLPANPPQAVHGMQGPMCVHHTGGLAPSLHPTPIFPVPSTAPAPHQQQATKETSPAVPPPLSAGQLHLFYFILDFFFNSAVVRIAIL